MTTTQTPPRPPFKVAGVAQLKHLNVRKEGPDDEKILAVDAKIVIDGLDRALCGYFDEALEPFLWRHESSGMIARNSFLQPVAYLHEISSASVTIDEQSFVGCDVHKFSIKPRDGGVLDLTCSVTLYPSAREVAELAKRVQDDVRVTLEGPPDLFDAQQEQKQ